MIGPGMTSRAKQITGLIAIVIAMALPIHVECGFPGAKCPSHDGVFREVCKDYELEPLGFYLLELVATRNVGFAYSRGEDCR